MVTKIPVFFAEAERRFGKQALIENIHQGYCIKYQQ